MEALFHEGKLIMYNCATIQEYMGHAFSFTTSRTYYRDDHIEALLTTLGEKVGLNGFASIQYIYHEASQTYYLVEVDIRTNAWMPYSRFTGQHFSDGLATIANPGGAFKRLSKPKAKDEKTRVILFDRDVRRCVKYRDYKGLLKWAVNSGGRWKFIPLYDWKLFSRVCKNMFLRLLATPQKR